MNVEPQLQMARFNMLHKSVHFESPAEIAKTNLLTKFSSEFVENVLSILNRNEIHILNDNWKQLNTDLQRYDPSTVSVPLFLFHFHNYAS